MTVKLNEPSGALIPGSPVQIKVITEASEEGVVLPTQAVQQDDSGKFVWIRDQAGTAQKKPVALGLEGVLQVEIKSGLEAEQTVLLPNPNTPLSVGQSVEVMEEGTGMPDEGEI